MAPFQEELDRLLDEKEAAALLGFGRKPWQNTECLATRMHPHSAKLASGPFATSSQP